MDKRLKVQIGVVKRMQKEVAAYEKEAKDNEGRVQKMKDDGKDEYDIKKQEEVLQESYMMIPDSKNRLEQAVEKLQEVVAEAEEEGGADETLKADATALLAVK
jgi:tubulin-specific chaperone A